MRKVTIKYKAFSLVEIVVLLMGVTTAAWAQPGGTPDVHPIEASIATGPCGGTWTTFTTADGLVGDWITDLAIESPGHLWVATNNGVSELDGGNWTNYTNADGLVDNVVYTLALEGSHKWFGTRFGANLFDGSSWTTYTTADGLVDDLVRAIAVDATGAKWFGTHDGVSVLDSGTWYSYTTEVAIEGSWINTAFIDGTGVKWFGTGNGVRRFDGTTWSYWQPEGLLSDHVYAIAEDVQGNLWFGGGHPYFDTGSGLGVFDGSEWTLYTEADGLVDDGINDIAVGPDGRLWSATWGGVSIFDGQNWVSCTTADGLAHNWVSAIAMDPDGDVWFGTQGGLNQFVPPDAPAVAPLLDPIHGTDGMANYTISWSAAPEGAIYFLEEDDSPLFPSPEIVYQGTDLQTTVTDQSLGTWYYRVRAVNAGGSSAWSQTQAVVVTHVQVYLPVMLRNVLFGLPAPVLLPISNLSGANNFTVDWTPVAGATSYILQESRDNAFEDAQSFERVDTVFFTGDHGPGRYYYRVSAKDSLQQSTWSNVESVDVLWEQEPNNDALTQANGPLISGLRYYGYMAAGFVTYYDEKDYYYFDLASPGPVELWLSHIASGLDYDLVLRDKNLVVVQNSSQVGNVDEHIATGVLAAGRYYIQVYNSSGLSDATPYYLDVSY